MYNKFADFEKRKFKERQMSEALHNHVEYIFSVDEEKIKSHIKQTVEENLKEKFKEILTDSDEHGEVIKIPVFKLLTDTDSANESCVDRFCPGIFGQFSLGLESILKERNVLDRVDREKDFADDRDYMNYLQSNNLELLIGARDVLANRKFSLTPKFEKLTEDWTVIYTMFMTNGLALKKDSIKVCIHSIDVVIRPQSISDEKLNYNNKIGQYTYSIYSGMPIDFEEHELEAFLHDNRRIIEISAEISVQIKAARAGALIAG